MLRDHPRRCGENYHYRVVLVRDSGSPPQVRGKPLYNYKKTHKGGITPAGAGKTRSLSASLPRARDHPRRCGENRCQRQPIIEYIGSPPQVRGKHRLNTFIRFTSRITPAYAGKTELRMCCINACRDHPRVCGENLSGRLLPAGESGSPPRMRGKRQHSTESRSGRRITPAYAGKTS